MPARSQFEDLRPDIVRIVRDLRSQQIDVDRLPYTTRFEQLYGELVHTTHFEITPNQFYTELLTVRKNYQKMCERYGIA